MTAASTGPEPPATDVAIHDLSTSMAPTAIALHLNDARASLAAAANALDGWYARQTVKRHSYVADGHDTVAFIGAATRDQYRVRADLIGELRADEDERAVRVDHMIAESQARQASVLPGGTAAGTPLDGGTA
jgi:hypothetical protein